MRNPLTRIGALAVLLLLSSVVVACANTPLTTAKSSPTRAQSAQITITPASQQIQLQQTYTGVTGTPDSHQNQVQARQLTATSSVTSSAIAATGHGHVNATYAYGTVVGCLPSTYNVAGPITISAGTQITDYSDTDTAGNSRRIVLTANLVMDITFNYGCSSRVSARYADIGSVGNIGDIHSSSGTTAGFNGFYSTYNAQIVNGIGHPFTGGQDAVDYTYLQQSDIDQATAAVANQSAPDATQAVNKLLNANEHLVGTPSCTSKVTTNHGVNDRVSSVTATKAFICTGMAYDYDGTLALAKQQLSAKAKSTLTDQYTLAGSVTVTLQSATLAADNTTVQLTADASGIWGYALTTTQEQTWAQAIKGMTQSQAKAWLLKQTGLAHVSIVLTGGNEAVLPASVSSITFVVATPKA